MSSFSQTSDGKWITKTSLPINRGELGGALIGDRIYLAGGFSDIGGGATDFQIYTPATNAWTLGPKMPVGLHHPNVGSANGKLYVLGGCDHTRRPDPGPNNSPWLGSHHAFEYDPGTNMWRTLKPLAHTAAASGVAYWGGKLYVIGGVDTNGIVLNLVQEYDPETDTWREMANMPIAREHIGVAVLDSLIYVVAGRTAGLSYKSITNFQAFDPNRNEWHILPNLPTARSGLALAAANGRLYALGGEWGDDVNGPASFDLNEEYDVVKKSWRTAAKMGYARNGFTAINYHDTVYAIGSAKPVETYIPPAPAVTLVGGSPMPLQARNQIIGLWRDVLTYKGAYNSLGRAVSRPLSLNGKK